jgi:flagella basal body P-ring formation protein FlgA
MTLNRFPINSCSRLRLLGATVCLLLIGSMATAASWAANVTEAQIRQVITAHVQEKLGTVIAKEDQPNVSINIIQLPIASLNFPDVQNAKDIQLQADSSLGDMYSERAIIRLTMTPTVGNAREVGIPIQISIKKPVWVVKNIITANEPLTLNNFSLEVRDVSHNYMYAVGQERDLSNYIARLNLRPGEILDARKIIIPPDVSYNDEVRILISSGNGMTISVPGIALANGRIGEMIRVRQSVFQQKYYSAKVIDKNQVLVEM